MLINTNLSKSRQHLFRFLSILLGLTLGLGIAEVIARVFYPLQPGVVQVTTLKAGEDNIWLPQVGWGHRFNSVERWRLVGQSGLVYDTLMEFNSHGLRGPDIPYEKPTGVFRILLISDSFIEATQLPFEETIVAQLQTLLNEHDSNTTYQVIGAGVAGWGTTQGYLFNLHEGYRYDPDLVMNLLVSNDAFDNVTYLLNPTQPTRPYFALEGDELVLHEKNAIPQNITLRELAQTAEHTIRPSSRLFAFISDFFVRRLFGSPPIQANYTEGDSRTAWLYDDLYPEAIQEEAWEVTRRVYTRWAKMLYEQEIPFIVAPASYLEAGEIRPYRELISTFNQYDVHYIPLNDRFADYEATTGEDLLGYADPHWNATGHRVAAEGIRDWLIQSGFLPS